MRHVGTVAAALRKARSGKGGGSAHEEGRKAYWRNEKQQKCPFADADLRKAWMDGWLQSQKEFENG